MSCYRLLISGCCCWKCPVTDCLFLCVAVRNDLLLTVGFCVLLLEMSCYWLLVSECSCQRCPVNDYWFLGAAVGSVLLLTVGFCVPLLEMSCHWPLVFVCCCQKCPAIWEAVTGVGQTQPCGSKSSHWLLSSLQQTLPGQSPTARSHACLINLPPDCLW